MDTMICTSILLWAYLSRFLSKLVLTEEQRANSTGYRGLQFSI